MSVILKGLIQAELTKVIAQLESVQATDPASVAAARLKMVDLLSTGLARAIQLYLNNPASVSVTGATVGFPAPHALVPPNVKINAL